MKSTSFWAPVLRGPISIGLGWNSVSDFVFLLQGVSRGLGWVAGKDQGPKANAFDVKTWKTHGSHCFPLEIMKIIGFPMFVWENKENH